MGTTLEDVTTGHLWQHFDAASALAQEGRWREAIPQFAALLAADVPRALRAHVLNDLGVAYQSLGDFEQAAANFQQSYDIYERDRNRLGAAIALGNLGTLHRQQREWQQAIYCFERSLLVFENLKIDNLALAYVSDKGFAQAQALLNRALALWEKLDDDAGQAMALWARAQLHFEQAEEPAGALERAAKDGQRALAIFTRLGRDDEAAAV